MKKAFNRLIVLQLLSVMLVIIGCTSMKGKTNEQGQDMMKLPPLKDQFNEYFLIGNIIHNGKNRAGIEHPSDIPRGETTVINERLTRHYNVVTHEDDMKPSSLTNGRNAQTGQISYTWDTADRMTNAALKSGFLVVGHTLLWHSQIPQWHRDMANQPKEIALAAMRQYIKDVMEHYAGKIYSWDVVNEIFPGSFSNVNADWRMVMRQENPWYKAIGADFIYEAFLAARRADPKAILYYNDYNLNERGKSTMVRNMVRDINEKYKTEYPNETRLLIEGIGMQSHHNTGVAAFSVQNTLDLFRPLGVKISISELDVLSQSWGEYSPNRLPPTEAGKRTAAQLYGEYFKIFLENADIIERITFWGVYDEHSWRWEGLPQIFEGSDVSRAKPAYYSIIEALNKHKENKDN